MSNIKFYLTIALLNTTSLTPSFSMEKDEDEKRSETLLARSEREIIATEQEDINHQLRLGRLYIDGYMGSEKQAKAVEWYTKAAEQGHGGAQLILARFYERGHGVKQDLNEAIKWYEKAARFGDSEAQFDLDACKERIKKK